MEVINSFFSNIKDKLTNPFFGTLLIILIIHHWEFVYTIFNFDNDCSLDEKLLILKNYIWENVTFKTVVVDFGYALLYMTLGYLIIIITRSIVLWIEYRLMPTITRKIVSEKVVIKSLYDEVVKEREGYFDQYEEQRKNVRVFSKTIDSQTEQIKKKDEALVKQSTDFTKTAERNNELTKELNLIQNKYEKSSRELEVKNSAFNALTDQYEYAFKRVFNFESLYFNELNVPHYNDINKFPPEIRNKANELINEGLWSELIALGDFKRKGGSLSGKTMTMMTEKGIIVKRLKYEEWTPVGEILYKYRNLFHKVEN